MLPFKKPFQKRLLAAGLLLAGFCSTAQTLIPPPVVQEKWSWDYAPFRIAGNLYYVGTYDLACYLITTPRGHILINTGLAESVPMIRAHVEALGYSFADIKILLATHAHYDHVGGMAAVKKMTGASMVMNEHDAPVLADGGNTDYIFGGKGSMFKPVKADRLLHDHDTIALGGMRIIALHHPGHTKGACSFLFDVKDEHRSYRVLIANMPTILDEAKFPTMPTYPDIGKDYGYTLDAMKNLSFDIWLSSHASQFMLQQKHHSGDAYHPEAFNDRRGYDSTITVLQKAYLKRLNAQ